MRQCADVGVRRRPRLGRVRRRRGLGASDPESARLTLYRLHRYNPTVATTLYMVIEHFKDRDPAPVYRRFRERGRLAPEGLTYINSWVDVNLERCYQLMETEDRALLDQWIANWRDIVEFEVHAVITSADAAARVADRL